MEPSTRHSLVLRLRDPRDEAAWTEFVEIYEPLIYQLARRKGLQDTDARDLCQEVFRAVASAIDRWDPDPAKGRFRAWLFRIARNLLLRFLASERRRVHGTGSTSVQELLEAQPAEAGRAAAEFRAEFQRRAFRWAAEQVEAEFSASTWQAFWKTGVENQSIAVVAKQLGLSTGAIYIARSRVLARLRERVEQLNEDSGLNLGGTGHDEASGNL
ncbi:MAG TPA: sigma-70 family RNA polymerase sigma factor [Gemmataceae bacterium]|nr:sigma-70 family RNA polymerase sigma factor [Gemmataceae bacterium]